MKTRTSMEIFAEILGALKAEPLTRSKIMYQTMLNFRQISNSSVILENAGLLNYVKEDRKYSITEKGRALLRLYEETSKLLNNSFSNVCRNEQ